MSANKIAIVLSIAGVLTGSFADGAEAKQKGPFLSGFGGTFDCSKLEQQQQKQLFSVGSIGGIPREVLEKECVKAVKACRRQKACQL